MSFTIGSHTFDRVHCDAGGDVLHLHKGDALSDADWDATPEGHGLSFNKHGELVGLTIVGPKRRLVRDGKLQVTLPEPVEFGARGLAGALVAV